MKTEVKVLIGFGVLALGYYLYKRKDTTVGAEKKSNAIGEGIGRTFCTCRNGTRCGNKAGVAKCTCCGSVGSDSTVSNSLGGATVSRSFLRR